MKIELHRIKIREITAGYKDDAENGVVGYGGKLNIRPKYQREFIYGDKERNAVIETIQKGFPLNVMYWVRGKDGTFELLDGQQRTVSFCQYVANDFSIHNRKFHNLTKPEREQILDYEVMIYICEGDEREQLDWFQIINIAGKPLTNQELRNAIYAGSWVTDAKAIFSKTNCAAHGLAKDYMSGTPIRQDYLERIIFWKSRAENQSGDMDTLIRNYMSVHQHDENAEALWVYFREVIEWVKRTFPKYRKEMKGMEWGILFNDFHEKTLDADTLEAEIQRLMADDDVTNKKGIYTYVLTKNERWLNIRAFTLSQKTTVYARQKGICARCQKVCEPNEMEADHIMPWSQGGKTDVENCQMLCRECNRRKSDK